MLTTNLVIFDRPGVALAVLQSVFLVTKQEFI